MDKTSKEQLDKIIDGQYIRTVFQPIVSLRDGTVVGHEALSRITCDTEIRDPEDLFQLAGKSDRLWDLEQLCRTVALQSAFPKTDPAACKKLFLNVNPNIMTENRHGVTERFPLVSLSVAGICDTHHRFSSLAELTGELAKIKKKSKMQKGNSLCIHHA